MSASSHDEVEALPQGAFVALKPLSVQPPEVSQVSWFLQAAGVPLQSVPVSALWQVPSWPVALHTLQSVAVPQVAAPQQTPSLHTRLRQSLNTRQWPPLVHGSHCVPPQSMSVSLPFFWWSVQSDTVPPPPVVPMPPVACAPAPPPPVVVASGLSEPFLIVHELAIASGRAAHARSVVQGAICIFLRFLSAGAVTTPIGPGASSARAPTTALARRAQSGLDLPPVRASNALRAARRLSPDLGLWAPSE